ncbi:uncharacterized protein LOC135498729 [Lineus longissimus]|uniref:uncharacterized protein LOC135498729 n=1 Tax=Lineus longissimus TaxID=88925 RepID=UPI002B4D873F
MPVPLQGQGHPSTPRTPGQGYGNLPLYEETLQLQPTNLPGAVYRDPYTPLDIPGPPPSYYSVFPESSASNPVPPVEIPPVDHETAVPPYPGTPPGQISEHVSGLMGHPPAYTYMSDPGHHIPPYPLTPTAHVPAYATAVANYSNSVHPLSRRFPIANPAKPHQISPAESDSDLSSITEDTTPRVTDVDGYLLRRRREPQELPPLPVIVQKLIRVGTLFSFGLVIIGGLEIRYETHVRVIGAGIWCGLCALIALVACHDPRKRYRDDTRITSYVIFNLIAIFAGMFVIGWYGFGLALANSYNKNCRFEGEEISNCSAVDKDWIPRNTAELRARFILQSFGIFLSFMIVFILIANWHKTKHLPGLVQPFNANMSTRPSTA